MARGRIQQIMYMQRDAKVNEAQPKTAEQIFAEKDAKIATLEAELAALKEKYRWRKQSEEPAPEDGLIAIYGASTNWFGMVNSDGFVGQNEYWHPLDLPEEAAK